MRSHPSKDSIMGPKLSVETAPRGRTLAKFESSVDPEAESKLIPKVTIFKKNEKKDKVKKKKIQIASTTQRERDYSKAQKKKLAITDYLLIFIKVIHLIRKLKKSLGFRNLGSLKENQYLMINDMSYALDQDELDYLREEDIIYTARRVSMVLDG
jgi:hypothetical protein